MGDYFRPSYINTVSVLESLGFEVDVCESMSQIEKKILQGEKYDIIFTNNIYQDGGSGYLLLEKLHSINGFNTPIIIHTISEKPKEYFLQQGFDGYLKKYITQEDTLNLLSTLLPIKKDED